MPQRMIFFVVQLYCQWKLINYSMYILLNWIDRRKEFRLQFLYFGMTWDPLSFFVLQQFVLTPRTEEKYNKINQEFDQMMKKNLLQPVSLTRIFIFFSFCWVVFMKILISKWGLTMIGWHVTNENNCLYMLT